MLSIQQKKAEVYACVQSIPRIKSYKIRVKSNQLDLNC